MNEILDKYLSSAPEIVFEWQDTETEAQGWLVINTLRNGAAGGGTRMRSGLTKDEVVSLAKVMGIKFSVCGPKIGGAKSGINFDPNDSRKNEVLVRWFKAIRPLLQNYYGTGGDLNVDEVKEVFPITAKLGIIHPQEGVLNGYFKYSEAKKQSILQQLDLGCKLKVISEEYSVDGKGDYNVADMITGFGVAESARHYYNIFHSQDLKNKRCLIQGWGNVAASAAFYLAKEGAQICCIIDKDYSIYEPNGLSLEEIKLLFLNKAGNRLDSSKMKRNEEISEDLWSATYDIFIPAAASRIVDQNHVNKLIANGLESIFCGANVPFIESKILYGDTSQLVDSKISLIPDFVANCGMARVFAYLMQENIEISEKAIFEDVSILIKSSLSTIYSNSESDKLLMNKFLSLYLYN
ncbi:MAG: Glu/Leu/Phe/Val dehydrogenase dimerization domain-containing protein [Saprospiraceae bacterium]